LESLKAIPTLEYLDTRLSKALWRVPLPLAALPNLKRLPYCTHPAELPAACVLSLRQLEDLWLYGYADYRAISQWLSLPRLKTLRAVPLGLVLKQGPEVLSRLTSLDLNPELVDPELRDLSALTALQVLEVVSANGATPVRLPPALRRLILDYENQKDASSCPVQKPWPKTLESVLIRRGPIDPEDVKADLSWLGDIPRLRDLALHNPDDSGLACLKQLPLLERLELKYMACQPHLVDWEAISRLNELETLVVTGRIGYSEMWCDLYKRADLGIGELRNLKKLRNLRIHGVGKVGFPLVTDSMTGLRTLDLKDQRHQMDSFGGDLSGIRALKDLTDLSLIAGVPEDGLGPLAYLKKLRRLKIIRKAGSSEGIAPLVKALPELERLEYNVRGDGSMESDDEVEVFAWPTTEQ
jgi:hypothetical protein